MSRDDPLNIVPLGVEPAPEEPPPITRPSRLHAWGTNGMTLFALLGIVSMLAFISVRWPNGTGRYVIGALIFSVVGFLFCASMAVSAAMRDSYARPPTVAAKEPDAARTEPVKDDQ